MKFSMTKLSLLFLSASLSVVGCNIFNPSGTADVDEDDADALIAYGQKQFRASQYGEAAELFSKAIALDSTKSEAYFGLAKSAMRAEGANPFDLLNMVTSTDTNEIPFMNVEKSKQNVYYRAMVAVEDALGPLVHRDTLTALWELASQGDKDPAFDGTLSTDLQLQVLEFRATYKSGNDYKYPPTNESFPVSDRKYKYRRYQADFTLAHYAGLVLGVLDLNRDGYIDERDPNINFSIGENGELTVDVSEVITAAITDTIFATSLNDNIDALANGTADVASLIEDLGIDIGAADSGSTDQATQEELKQQIDQLGDAVRFYKIGDRKDNDGDGCVDEEMMDSVDNDGDGFVDEDLRLTPDPIAHPGIDMVDNDADGLVDLFDTDEYWVGGIPPAVDANNKRLLPFIESLPENIPDSSGVLHRNSTIVSDKVNVVHDSLGTQYPLSVRKTLIGGCWNYYNESSFQNYLTRQ